MKHAIWAHSNAKRNVMDEHFVDKANLLDALEMELEEVGCFEDGLE